MGAQRNVFDALRAIEGAQRDLQLGGPNIAAVSAAMTKRPRRRRASAACASELQGLIHVASLTRVGTG